MDQQEKLKNKWSLFPKRTRFLAISPWLYAILVFLITIAFLGFLSQTVGPIRTGSRVSRVLGGIVIKTDKGLEIWDGNIHGDYTPKLHSSKVGYVSCEYPEYNERHARGSLHLGMRITVLVEINSAPADIRTVMDLLPLIEKHYRINAGTFLNTDKRNGIIYYSHPDYPWRFKWSGLVWDVVAALPIIVFLWLIGWQIKITWVDRGSRRLADGICPRCRYNIRNLPEPRCPECGTTW